MADGKINPLDGLAEEDRQGIPHYVTGQHKAWKLTDPETGAPDVLLRYVNVLGRAVLVLCAHGRGAWQPLALSWVAVTGVGKGWDAAPDEFELSDLMLAAIEDAEELWPPTA